MPQIPNTPFPNMYVQPQRSPGAAMSQGLQGMATIMNISRGMESDKRTARTKRYLAKLASDGQRPTMEAMAGQDLDMGLIQNAIKMEEGFRESDWKLSGQVAQSSIPLIEALSNEPPEKRGRMLDYLIQNSQPAVAAAYSMVREGLVGLSVDEQGNPAMDEQGNPVFSDESLAKGLQMANLKMTMTQARQNGLNRKERQWKNLPNQDKIARLKQIYPRFNEWTPSELNFMLTGKLEDVYDDQGVRHTPDLNLDHFSRKPEPSALDTLLGDAGQAGGGQAQGQAMAPGAQGTGEAEVGLSKEDLQADPQGSIMKLLEPALQFVGLGGEKKGSEGGGSTQIGRKASPDMGGQAAPGPGAAPGAAQAQGSPSPAPQGDDAEGGAMGAIGNWLEDKGIVDQDVVQMAVAKAQEGANAVGEWLESLPGNAKEIAESAIRALPQGGHLVGQADAPAPTQGTPQAPTQPAPAEPAPAQAEEPARENAVDMSGPLSESYALARGRTPAQNKRINESYAQGAEEGQQRMDAQLEGEQSGRQAQESREVERQVMDDLMQFEGFDEVWRQDRQGEVIGHGLQKANLKKMLEKEGKSLPDKITRAEARKYTMQYVREVAEPGAKRAIGMETWGTLSPKRKAVLIEMVYQIGEDGVDEGGSKPGFTKMLQAIKEGNWNQAARELFQSNFGKQTPNRAKVLAERMREG